MKPGDRVSTPVQSSGAYPTLQQSAEEAAARVADRDDDASRWLRGALLDIAEHLRGWSPSNRPAEHERLRIVERLRVCLELETALQERKTPG